jgi:hypothetical protein
MKNKLAYCILIFLTFLLIRCGTDSKKENQKNTDPAFAQPDSLQRERNTVQLQETFNEEDIPVNEYLTDNLKPIRGNFKRINSIKNWTSVGTEELSESTEGGEAKYYYQNGQLEKIVTRQLGESFQLLTEYYLMNGQLSFVFEKHLKYNRPFYYDSTAMKENNDTETFDPDKSKIIEDRSYFENGKLLYRVNNQDHSSTFAPGYLPEEQKRIKADFDKLIELTKNKQKPKR